MELHGERSTTTTKAGAAGEGGEGGEKVARPDNYEPPVLEEV